MTKCDMDQLNFSQFGWLNFGCDSSHSELSVMKPIGFHSLPFSFLADTVSRNRTFVHHVGLPLVEGLEMILRYLQWHLS